MRRRHSKQGLKPVSYPASAPRSPQGSSHWLDTEAAGGQLVFPPRPGAGQAAERINMGPRDGPSSHLLSRSSSFHAQLSFPTSPLPLKPNCTGCEACSTWRLGRRQRTTAAVAWVLVAMRKSGVSERGGPVSVFTQQDTN